MNIERLSTGLLEQLKRDLTPFADPVASGPRIEFNDSGSSVMARWESRGQDHEAHFLRIGEGVRVVADGKQQSYYAFLAEIGEVDALARRMVSYYPDDSRFIPTKARTEDKSLPAESALDLLRAVVSRIDSREFTRVIFITGDAGAGKTRILKKLMRDQAVGYQSGDCNWLYFYVDAQGRALATLDEALAVELDNLRSRLTYSMLPTLVRNGLVVPIIDGFDELLGSSYDDAFASLGRFLEQLNGQGRLIACSRSTYYEQEFTVRANGSSPLGSQTWSTERVQLIGWATPEKNAFLAALCAEYDLDDADCDGRKRAVNETIKNETVQGLYERPFFFTRIARLAFDERRSIDDRDALRGLVDANLARECREKLLHKGTTIPLLTTVQLAAILTHVAQEMWLQETRELDTGTVRDCVDLVANSESLQHRVHEYVNNRGPMLGFLTPRGARRIEFEHELFFSYFLAKCFADEIAGGGKSLAWLLPRSHLPTQCADIAVQFLRERGCDLESTIRKLCGAVDPASFRAEQMRQNAGALVASCLRAISNGSRLNEVSGVRLVNVSFAGEGFPGIKFVNCMFDGVVFRRTDLTRTQFSGCVAENVLLDAVVVDPEFTRMDVAGVNVTSGVVGLQVGIDAHVEYSPSEIIKVLAACRLPSAHDAVSVLRHVDLAVYELVRRLAAAYERTSVVWPSDDHMKWLAGSPLWPGVRDLMIVHNVIAADGRQQRHQPRESYRRNYAPAQIMAGANPNADVPSAIRDFWDALEKLDPSA